jgi:hypothetical protein
MTADLDLWSTALPKLPTGTLRQQVIPEEMEPFLKPCPCGGRFSSHAAPRCPRCSQVISADEAATWIEKNAPGTSSGWRWQRSWSGLYCIVIENRVIHDNFAEAD